MTNAQKNLIIGLDSKRLTPISGPSLRAVTALIASGHVASSANGKSFKLTSLGKVEKKMLSDRAAKRAARFVPLPTIVSDSRVWKSNSV